MSTVFEIRGTFPATRSRTFDQGTNVLDPPSCNPWTKLDGFRKASRTDTSPPSGLADGDDGGNWWVSFGVADDLFETEESCDGYRVGAACLDAHF